MIINLNIYFLIIFELYNNYLNLNRSKINNNYYFYIYKMTDKPHFNIELRRGEPSKTSDKL